MCCPKIPAEAVPSSPHVMLSPNARKEVVVSLGGGSTTTGKVQDAARAFASLVEQVTVVVPTGNVAPLTGVQLVLSGAWPPVTVGAPNETGCPDPSSESTGSGAIGQAIWGGFVAGVGAVDVLPPHATNHVHTLALTKTYDHLNGIRCH